MNLYDAVMAVTDIRRLADEFPAWLITSTWVAVATGPDRRVLLAVRKSDGLIVGGQSEDELRDKIEREKEGA